MDPRGALLAAPTGYVSKVLLDVSNCAQRNSRVVPREWTHAKYALDSTAVRALAMTADLFQDSSVGADVVAGRTDRRAWRWGLHRAPSRNSTSS